MCSKPVVIYFNIILYYYLQAAHVSQSIISPAQMMITELQQVEVGPFEYFLYDLSHNLESQQYNGMAGYEGSL
jgi:hypothetical protein